MLYQRPKSKQGVLFMHFTLIEAFIRRKRSQFWQNGDWYTLHDHVPTYRSQLLKKFIAKTLTNVFSHPPTHRT